MVSRASDGLVIDFAHPRIRQTIELHADDRLRISFLASRAYTALDSWCEDITDADETAFHACLAWLRAALEV